MSIAVEYLKAIAVWTGIAFALASLVFCGVCFLLLLVLIRLSPLLVAAALVVFVLRELT